MNRDLGSVISSSKTQKENKTTSDEDSLFFRNRSEIEGMKKINAGSVRTDEILLSSTRQRISVNIDTPMKKFKKSSDLSSHEFLENRSRIESNRPSIVQIWHKKEDIIMWESFPDHIDEKEECGGANRALRYSIKCLESHLKDKCSMLSRGSILLQSHKLLLSQYLNKTTSSKNTPGNNSSSFESTL